MGTFICETCKKSMPSKNVKGSRDLKTVQIEVPWQSELLTVMSAGEHCYPCPRCETNESGEPAITHWENADTRLHKRLRQHFKRYHHQSLADAFSPAEVSAFYEKARQLRCKLIHGPCKNDSASDLSKSSSEAEASPATTPVKTQITTSKSPKNFAYASNYGKFDYQPPKPYVRWLKSELSKSYATYISVARGYLAWVS